MQNTQTNDRVTYQREKIQYHIEGHAFALANGNESKAEYHASKIKYAEDKLRYLGAEV